MSRTKSGKQAPLSFGRYCDVISGKVRYILAALRSPQANSARRSARRGRPGCFADLSPAATESPRLFPHAQWQEARQDQPREDKTITSSFLHLPLGQQPSAMVSRRDPYNENITRHEAEPAFSGSVIVATSLHAVEPKVGPNHDADIRIGSEAPKQRCPFLIAA